MKPDTNSSPLLQRIAEAMTEHHISSGCLHVSVARDAMWEKSPSSSDEVLVRWLCWSIELGEEELVPPNFEVIHPDVSEEQLRDGLREAFPALELVVDNEIDV